MSTRRLDVTGHFAPKKFGRLNPLTSLERETNEHSQKAESADKLTGEDEGTLGFGYLHLGHISIAWSEESHTRDICERS